MSRPTTPCIFLFAALLASILLAAAPLRAAEAGQGQDTASVEATLEAASKQADITGWERDSAYNALYDLETFDKVKGYLEEIFEIAPLEGMVPGLAVTMTLKEGDAGMGEAGELVTVHFGPRRHVRFLPYVAEKGDKLTVRGSWVDVQGEKVLMASKIKVNEIFEFKVRRTSDGTPYWTMTKEELVREKLAE